MDQKEKIKHFLYTCKNYVVLHEEDPKNKNKECYFIFIAKKDISKSYSVVHDVLNVYCEELPLKNVSVATKTFMEMNKNKFYFVYLDELEQDDTEVLNNLLAFADDLSVDILLNSLSIISLLIPLSTTLSIIFGLAVRTVNILAGIL